MRLLFEGDPNGIRRHAVDAAAALACEAMRT